MHLNISYGASYNCCIAPSSSEIIRLENAHTHSMCMYPTIVYVLCIKLYLWCLCVTCHWFCIRIKLFVDACVGIQVCMCACMFVHTKVDGCIHSRLHLNTLWSALYLSLRSLIASPFIFNTHTYAHTYMHIHAHIQLLQVFCKYVSVRTWHVCMCLSVVYPQTAWPGV